MEELSTNSVENSSDNSDISLDEQIEQALEEPEETAAEETTEEPSEDGKQEPSKQQDNSINCPDKFKNEDGSINLKNLVKSYGELEHLQTEKSAWEKERAELLEYKKQLDAQQQQNEDRAKQAGFDSALDMQQAYQVAQFEANQYARYLQYLDDETRDNVQSLLYQYSNNPSQELMEQIEIEFAPEINKTIAVQADRMKQQFTAQKQQQAQTEHISNIENIISKSVEAENELFNYEPFKELFVNALHRFGEKFTYEDAEALMKSVKALKASFEEEFKKGNASNEANKKATDALASITGQSSAQTSSKTDNVDIRTISDNELNKLLDKYI